jgi:choline dehydrogenase-like flavoprotein
LVHQRKDGTKVKFQHEKHLEAPTPESTVNGTEKRLPRAVQRDDVFDYVIVGAGAAGSVLANRLSQDPDNQVLLLESGGRDWNPLLYVPKGFAFTLRDDRYAYDYSTQHVRPSGQREVWLRGKGLGGTTVVNGMMWTRGAPADWDGLEARGNPGWNWEHALAAYRTIEDHSLGASDMRGAGGPLGISVPESDDEIVRAALAAGQAMGWERVADSNASDSERIGFVPSTIKHGVRTSGYSAFVHPIRTRPNLTIATHTRASRLLFEGNRAVGVRAANGAQMIVYRARKEVILSAGTIETPLLLERSGIGHPDVLGRAGIGVRIESPNVGERMIEQRVLSVQFRFKGNVGYTARLNSLPKQGWEGFKYLFTRSGPIAMGSADVVMQFKSSPALDRPDIQGMFVTAVDASSPDSDFRPADHSGTMIEAFQIRPTTASSVHVGGRLPENAPIIDARFFENEGDREALAPVLGIVRELFAKSPLADQVLDEEFPGPAVSTNDEVLRYSFDNGGPGFHAVGSSAMGPNSDDVVDPQLRVRGVDGLRVVDASVLPVQVAGNTQAPTMAVARIGADLILNSH